MENEGVSAQFPTVKEAMEDLLIKKEDDDDVSHKDNNTEKRANYESTS